MSAQQTTSENERGRPKTFIDWKERKEDMEKEIVAVPETPGNLSTLQTGNKTAFDIGEVDKSSNYTGRQRRLYNRLDKHNRDNHQYRADTNISESVITQFKIHEAKAFGYELGMTDSQVQEAVKRLLKINVSRFGHRTELVAFCFHMNIVNRDARRRGRDTIYHPNKKRSDNDPEFQKLADYLAECYGEITESMIVKVANKLRQGRPPERPTEKWGAYLREEREQLSSNPVPKGS